MRQLTISDETIELKMATGMSETDALQARAPWAAKFEKVEGGWIAFESVSDWQVWINQK